MVGCKKKGRGEQSSLDQVGLMMVKSSDLIHYSSFGLNAWEYVQHASIIVINFVNV